MTSVRRTGTVSVATLLGLALTIGLTHAAAPEWTRRTGLDVWNLSSLREQTESAAKRDRELQAEHDQVRRRLEAKDHLIQNLTAGRITLREITAKFLALDQCQPEITCIVLAAYKGNSDEEKMARNVIDYAGPKITGSLPRTIKVVARLDVELREITGDPATETR